MSGLVGTLTSAQLHALRMIAYGLVIEERSVVEDGAVGGVREVVPRRSVAIAVDDHELPEDWRIPHEYRKAGLVPLVLDGKRVSVGPPRRAPHGPTLRVLERLGLAATVEGHRCLRWILTGKGIECASTEFGSDGLDVAARQALVADRYQRWAQQQVEKDHAKDGGVVAFAVAIQRKSTGAWRTVHVTRDRGLAESSARHLIHDDLHWHAPRVFELRPTAADLGDPQLGE